MSAKFQDAAAAYIEAKWNIADSQIELGTLLTQVFSTPINAATVAKHSAMMSKIQMHARKIVEAALDAQVECDIAQAEEAQ